MIPFLVWEVQSSTAWYRLGAKTSNLAEAVRDSDALYFSSRLSRRWNHRLGKKRKVWVVPCSLSSLLNWWHYGGIWR